MADKDYYNILNILGIRLGGGAKANESGEGDSIITEDIEPCYVISVAARILGIRSHTLRYYERKGIIEPSRSQGNIRLYSRRDIDQLRRVKTLMDDLGVNPTGAEIILRMRQHMTELLRRLEKLESEVERLREVNDL
jgi:MerR family transcriptional regulator/heat shock protein HspR